MISKIPYSIKSASSKVISTAFYGKITFVKILNIYTGG